MGTISEQAEGAPWSFQRAIRAGSARSYGWTEGTVWVGEASDGLTDQSAIDHDNAHDVTIDNAASGYPVDSSSRLTFARIDSAVAVHTNGRDFEL